MILGLHHSGTTIFWRAWRADPRFLCFDEPLTGDIGVWFPGNNPKRTHDEYAELFPDNPEWFWDLYAPIEPFQQLDSALSMRQERYIRTLCDRAPNIVIDETHLHLHLPTLREITPDAFVIHLYRRARGFVTSHLLPSRSRQTSLALNIKQRVGHAYRKHVFWNRFEIPLGADLHKVIGRQPYSKFALLLSDAGYDVDRIMRATAVVRLLAYWHYQYHFLQREGPKQFGDRFLHVPYESFAQNPRQTMVTLYGRVGVAPPDGVAYPEIHLPKPPFRQDDKRWRDAARVAGFREEELDTLL